MSDCYRDGCLVVGTKARPLIVVAEKLGASYGGSVVYACPRHAAGFSTERPPQSEAGLRRRHP